MEEEKDYKELPVWYKKKIIGHIKVDPEDYEYLSHFCFKRNRGGYPYTEVENRKNFYPHRHVMNCPDDKVVDHVYHDKYDCRKKNLRVVYNTENIKNQKLLRKNSTGYRGVSKRPNGKYEAYASLNGKKIGLGLFNNLEDAIQTAKNKRAELNHLDDGMIPDVKPLKKERNKKQHSSPYEGITWDKQRNGWRVDIVKKRKRVFSKRFDNLDEARKIQLEKIAELTQTGVLP